MISVNTTTKQLLSSFQNRPYPPLHLPEPLSSHFGSSVIWQISHILKHLYSTTIFKPCEYALILNKTMMIYFNILFSLVSFKTLSHMGETQISVATCSIIASEKVPLPSASFQYQFNNFQALQRKRIPYNFLQSIMKIHWGFS